MMELECENCGEEFERYRSNVKQADADNNFCSRDCHNDFQRAENLTEEQIAGLRQGWEMSLEHDEETKNKLSEALKGREPNEGSFTSEEMSGENHPNWKGGVSYNRGENWNQQRKKALKRDNHRCQECGGTAEEVEYRLEVHHKIPYKDFSDSKEANRLSNLETLCLKCHRKVEWRDNRGSR